MSIAASSLTPGMRFEEWREVGRELTVNAARSLWEIADWVRYGEDAYGKTYEEALDVTGLEKQTLMNMVQVAERIYRRRENLSFAHHAEVAFIRDPETQDSLLSQAILNGWSRNELREQAAKYREQRQLPKADTRPMAQVVFKLKLTPDVDELVQAEAKAEEMQPEDWIVSAIREKAERRMQVAA